MTPPNSTPDRLLIYAWKISAPVRGFTRTAALLLALLASHVGSPLHAQSCYPQRPGGPAAVDFAKEGFETHDDGLGDDADALQKAINRVQETTRAGTDLTVTIPAVVAVDLSRA